MERKDIANYVKKCEDLNEMEKKMKYFYIAPIILIIFLLMFLVMIMDGMVTYSETIKFCKKNGYDGFTDKGILGKEFYCYKNKDGFIEYSKEVFT